MANVVQIVLQGDDQSRAAFASATASANRFSQATRTMSSDLRTTSRVFGQVQSVAHSFGASTLANLVGQAEGAALAFRSFNNELGKSKVAAAGLVVAAGAVGVSVGTAIEKVVDAARLTPWAQQTALMDLQVATMKEINNLTDANIEKRKAINAEIDKGISVLTSRNVNILGFDVKLRPDWLDPAAISETIAMLERLRGAKLSALGGADFNKDAIKAAEIMEKLDTASMARQGGMLAIIVEKTKRYSDLRETVENLRLTEEEYAIISQRIADAQQVENEHLRDRGILLEATREQFLQGGLEATVKFTEGAGAATLGFLDGQRAAAAAYYEIWSTSLQNVRGAFLEFTASAITSFSQGFGNAVASIATGAQTAGQAFAALGKQMLGMLVSFIARLALNTALTLVFQSTIGAATGALATSLAAAWAPAAAFASLASFGSNAGPAAAGILSTVALAQGLALAGVAHGGLDRVPNEGTFLLSRGERVLQPAANEDLTRFLRDQDGAGSRTAQISIHLDGTLIAQAIGQMSRDGRLTLDARSIT